MKVKERKLIFLIKSFNLKKIFVLIVVLTITLTITYVLRSKSNTSLEVSPPVLAQTSPNDWPQVQKDPQHTGFSSETLGTNFQVAWTYPFQPDRVHPQVQAIIYRGKVFIGTEGANGQKPRLIAISAGSGTGAGQKVWEYEAGGPILNSAAADNGMVYFASLDGAVYAIDSDTGTQVWKNQLMQFLGFSSAPILAENKIFIGGQDGRFYALDTNNGNTLWSYDTGSPILMTAAYNQNKVYFGAQNMYVYALDTASGSLVWKSQKILGGSFKEYWPVIHQGNVIIRPMSRTWMPGVEPGSPFQWGLNSSNWDWLSQWGSTISAGNASQVPDIMSAQDTVISNYQANPNNYTKSLYILDESTGGEAMVVPHSSDQTMDGQTTPPCVDRDGNLVMPLMFIASGWGRLSLTQQRFIDILYDGTDYRGQPVSSTTVSNQVAGFGNGDENMQVSCTANMVLGFHIQEENANYTGYFNLDTRRWTRVSAGHLNKEMSHNTQGGGGNPPSVSNGMVYHVSWHNLIARKTN
jgi:outer membrane protein assembly factor BamB